jgi:hypothetical protein
LRAPDTLSTFESHSLGLILAYTCCYVSENGNLFLDYFNSPHRYSKLVTTRDIGLIYSTDLIFRTENEVSAEIKWLKRVRV